MNEKSWRVTESDMDADFPLGTKKLTQQKKKIFLSPRFSFIDNFSNILRMKIIKMLKYH